MIFFKFKVVLWGLILSTLLLVSGLSAAEIKVPLPFGSIKVSERSANFGAIKLTIETYSLALPLDKVRAFYAQQMPRNGWQEKKEGFFIKDNKYSAAIKFYTGGSQSIKTEFKIITGNLPAVDQILAQRLTKPDKLDFMPVYPKSLQVFHWDFPPGVTCSYETESSIKDVVFFYKSAMLNYGWSLDDEVALTAGISLSFHRAGKGICEIQISNITPEMDAFLGTKESANLATNKSQKTGILVNYKKYGKIKP